MAIEPERAIGADLGEDRVSWNEENVILYHLGIGAAMDPLDEAELDYVWEDRLKVLPTFASGLGLATALRFLEAPGIEVDEKRIMHGEHLTTVHRPLPVRGSAIHAGRIAGVWDKGGAALIEIDVETRDASSGEPLVTNRFSIFAKGAGGFGGERGPDKAALPEVSGPAQVEQATALSERLPLIYRLSGDRHPFHVDPQLARSSGFERPIIAGLCTFGAVCKAMVQGALGDDVASVGSLRARFANVVYPGETLRTKAWSVGSDWVAEAATDRAGAVLSHGLLTTR